MQHSPFINETLFRWKLKKRKYVNRICDSRKGKSNTVYELLSLYIANPQQGDLRLLGSPSDRSADGRARTRDRRVPADLRADLQGTVPPTLPTNF
ncbi:hypothetical protein PoB_006106300 [Plakobranchus ocellatus]|uniref:Uncharacterized protein n=1 Tax=Plakobranchus ocellatus TaxID=259542 RepID=A0AAV4CRL6_9GAST|nr:hypothetical protein PoB_006106300 [Plakobranchus ocellatus]